jgi:uncharacterized protein (DUF58 family)
MGENFWQYRRHTTEDSVERVDWRRSAREENLFVRETELETARTFLFWCDPSPGFHWSSADSAPFKADRALLLCMSLAGALSRSGERCGALGGGRGAVSGARAPSRVGEVGIAGGEAACGPSTGCTCMCITAWELGRDLVTL